jgi:replication factor A1
VQFHYALVDDLLSKEEFERRVEEKIKECGDLVDELTGAMLVVRDLGREHVKIKGLAGKSSLFTFFGKVTGKTEPKEFNRADGEKGLVATVTVGDETGEARMVLWDEKAMAVPEVDVGDVLEIIGKPGKRQGDIMVMALRKATCEIECRSEAGSLNKSIPASRVDLDARLLALEEPRTFNRRDGTSGEMLGAIIGDEKGTARLICWNPELLKEMAPGMSLHITGATDRSRPPLREYSIDEKSMVDITKTLIEVPFSRIASVSDEGVYSIMGRISYVAPWKSFLAKDGSRSSVRNIAITDESGTIRLVVWGDRAENLFFNGDLISVFNARARTGRSGDRELSVGRDSSFVTEAPPGGGPIEFQGTIISCREGIFIDNGEVSYLLHGDFPHGREVRVTGTLTGHTIVPETIEAVDLDPAALYERCRHLKEGPLFNNVPLS